MLKHFQEAFRAIRQSWLRSGNDPLKLADEEFGELIALARRRLTMPSQIDLTHQGTMHPRIAAAYEELERNDRIPEQVELLRTRLRPPVGPHERSARASILDEEMVDFIQRLRNRSFHTDLRPIGARKMDFPTGSWRPQRGVGLAP